MWTDASNDELSASATPLTWRDERRRHVARRWTDRGGGRAATDEYGQKLYQQTEESDRTVVERLNQLAERKKLPPAQVALAWMLHKPVVTAPIIGATKPHHLDDAVAALEVELSPNEIVELEEAYVPHPVLGFA